MIKRQIATVLAFLILGAGITETVTASSAASFPASTARIDSTAASPHSLSLTGVSNVCVLDSGYDTTPITDLPHSLGLTGVSNARGLGGYETTDGKAVKSGMLLRTAALNGATDADIKKLTDAYHLKQIIDFRRDGEVKSKPDPTITGVTNTQINIVESTTPAASSADTSSKSSKSSSSSGNPYVDQVAAAIKALGDINVSMENAYLEMITSEHSIAGYKQFFDLLLTRQSGSILYHCTAGKDRTGIASILLLSALGVDKDTIIED